MPRDCIRKIRARNPSKVKIKLAWQRKLNNDRDGFILKLKRPERNSLFVYWQAHLFPKIKNKLRKTEAHSYLDVRSGFFPLFFFATFFCDNSRYRSRKTLHIYIYVCVREREMLGDRETHLGAGRRTNLLSNKFNSACL